MWSIFLFLFLLGLGVGSFLNCLVYRLHLRGGAETEQRRHLGGVIWGRSFCPHCQHQLAWYDNIPLLSFLLLRGKCRYCHSPISWQYPLVELATGILTVSIFNFQFSIFNLLITYALIAIFVSDLRYGTIPDEIVLPAMGLAALFHLRGGLSSDPGSFSALARSGIVFWSHLGGVLLSALGAAAFFLLLVLITRGRGMGMGDVKLAGLMGLILGWPKILTALYLAFLTGAFVGVILILLRKKRFGQPIPFGPFLAGAAWITLFL